MILRYPPITLDTYQGIPIAWWTGEHILSGCEKVEMEQGFLMLLRIRFYYLKKLMTGLCLEFSIFFLEPRVTDNKGSIILRSVDDYSICHIVFSRSKPPLTPEVVIITWENCITPPTTLSLGFATRSSPTLCSPENGSEAQDNQPKGCLEFEEFRFAFTTWVRALWCLVAELEGVCSTLVGRILSSGKKLWVGNAGKKAKKIQSWLLMILDLFHLFFYGWDMLDNKGKVLIWAKRN